MERCKQEEEAIKQFFQSNQHLVYACCLDLWKSRAKQHYLGVVVQFITGDWQLMKVCLGVKHINVSHTAQHIFDATTKLLTEFGVTPSCYVADNASNQVLCNTKLADWSDSVGSGTVPSLCSLSLTCNRDVNIRHQL